MLSQISKLLSSNSSSYTKTEWGNLFYNITSVDRLVKTLYAEITALMTADLQIQRSVRTIAHTILKPSTAVALSATVPEVYLQIPDTSFIGVRNSECSNSVCVCVCYC